MSCASPTRSTRPLRFGAVAVRRSSTAFSTASVSVSPFCLARSRIFRSTRLARINTAMLTPMHPPSERKRRRSSSKSAPFIVADDLVVGEMLVHSRQGIEVGLGCGKLLAVDPPALRREPDQPLIDSFLYGIRQRLARLPGQPSDFLFDALCANEDGHSVYISCRRVYTMRPSLSPHRPPPSPRCRAGRTPPATRSAQPPRRRAPAPPPPCARSR